MLDAETVITVAKKVKLKRDETKRRRVNRRALYMDILRHWQFHGVVESSLVVVPEIGRAHV